MRIAKIMLKPGIAMQDVSVCTEAKTIQEFLQLIVTLDSFLIGQDIWIHRDAVSCIHLLPEGYGAPEDPKEKRKGSFSSEGNIVFLEGEPQK